METLKLRPRSIWTIGLVAVGLLGFATRGQWLPNASLWVQETVGIFRTQPTGTDVSNHDGLDHAPNPHQGHGHEVHEAHDEATSLELSKQGLRNVGLTPDQLQPVKLQVFRKSITVPAVVAERPGRTRVQVATPMTGVITHVRAVQGEAVEPGTLLFKIRLTHEDLVQAQTDFLKTLGELDVEDREIQRLTGITNSGAVAGKVLLERKYAKNKLSALLQAQRESLRLHGLSSQQVDQIAKGRRLLRELQIVAPSIDEATGESEAELKLSGVPTRPVSYSPRPELAISSESNASPLILQQLNVHKGQSVMAGETLCVLADYGELFIEGLAFEADISLLRNASENGWTVDAIFERQGTASRVLEGLEIAYLSNQVDSESRTLRFYVYLPNEVTKDRRADGNRFVEWKYLPGQRLQLRVPVDEWPDQIVLPIEAVAREGAEFFVFQQNGDHFDRMPVHVKFKDQHSVVIENDGSLFPGDVVAMRGAHQMQMALKNKSGGGVDPHAGHNH